MNKIKTTILLNVVFANFVFANEHHSLLDRVRQIGGYTLSGMQKVGTGVLDLFSGTIHAISGENSHNYPKNWDRMDFSIDPEYSAARTISRVGSSLALAGGSLSAYLLSNAIKTTNSLGNAVTYTFTGSKASFFLGALGISAVGLAATVAGSNFMIEAKENLYSDIQQTSFFGDEYVFQPNAIKNHNNQVVAYYTLSQDASQVTVEMVRNPQGQINKKWINGIKQQLANCGLSQKPINFVFSSKVSWIEQNALSGAKSVAFLQKEPINVQNGNNVDVVYLQKDSLINPQKFGCQPNHTFVGQSRGILFKKYKKQQNQQ